MKMERVYIKRLVVNIQLVLSSQMFYIIIELTCLSVRLVPLLYVVAIVEAHSSRYHGDVFLSVTLFTDNV